MILDAIKQGFYWLMLSLDGLVYTLISWFYQVFNVLASCQLFTSDIYQGLAQRIYVIIGIVTLFMLSYQLLLLVINPDEQKNFGDGKKIVINVVTSLAMILLVPTAFNVLFSFQNAVLSSDALGELILSNVAEDDSINRCTNSNTNNALGCYGNKMAVDTFQAFFYPANANVSDIENGTSASEITAEYGDQDITLNQAYEIATTEGRFHVFASFAENVVDGEISYTFLISTILGLILAYVIFVYCLDLGLRAVKLAFYEIIAPLPIIVRVIPSQTKMFSSWVKATLSTYAEVFIRIAILYFAVFAFSYIPSIMSGIFQGSAYVENPVIYFLVRAILILGIIMFVRRFPELLSEITGIKSGNFSASFMDRIKEAAFIPAAIGGAIVGKTPAAAFRAGRAAWKNKDLRSIGAEAKRRAEYEDLRNQGMSRWEIYKYRKNKEFRENLGYDSPYEAQIRNIDYQSETVENKGRIKLKYKDANGEEHVIDSNQAITIDNATIERFEAQKLENVQQMSIAKDEIGNLQKDIDYGKRVSSIASNIKDEAEKKIDEKGSKELFTIQIKNRRPLLDAEGNKIREEEYLTDFTGNYQQIADRIDKMSDDERLAYNLTDIRQSMIKAFIDRESKVDGMVKNELETGFETIKNNGGWTYKFKGVDNNGHEITISRKIEIEKGENGYNAFYMDVDAQGNKSKIYLEDDNHEKLTGYELADTLKGLSKGSNNIIGLEVQNIQQTEVDPLEAQNAGLDALIRQSKEKKEAKKNSSKMQNLKKADGYIASNKPPEGKK